VLADPTLSKTGVAETKKLIAVPNPPASVPVSAVLESAVLESLVLESAVLESAVLESVVLESDMPESLVLESVVPESLVLESVVPESLVLESVVPESLVLESVVLESEVPPPSSPHAPSSIAAAAMKMENLISPRRRCMRRTITDRSMSTMNSAPTALAARTPSTPNRPTTAPSMNALCSARG